MRIFFFTYAFPPLKYPRAIQISHLVRHFKHKINLLHSDENTTKDNSLDFGFEKSLESRTIKKLSYLRSKLTSIYERLYPSLIQTPDQFKPWAYSAAKKLDKKFKLNAEDTVFSFGQPMSNHLAILKFKKKCGFKWIAHFSDPWSDSPYRSSDPRTIHINNAQEKSVIDNCDKVIFTCQETLDLIMNKYPGQLNKSLVVPHCFEPQLHEKYQHKDKSDSITIRYLGTFYGKRSPISFLDAALLLDNNIKNKLKIEFYGDFSAQVLNQSQGEKYISLNCNFYPSVSYLKSLELMHSSDLLLLIDAPAEKNIFLPSKLIDYIGSSRPVFAVTPEGASKQLVKQMGCYCADPDKPNEISSSLKLAIEKISIFENNEDFSKFRDQFSVENIVKQYEALIL